METLKQFIEAECLDLGFEQATAVEQWLNGVDDKEYAGKVLALNEEFLKDCELITEKWAKGAEALGVC